MTYPQSYQQPVYNQQMPPSIPGGAGPMTAGPVVMPPAFVAPSGIVSNPHPRNLAGKLVILQPLRIDDQNKFGDTLRPNLYCKMVIVTPGEVQYGDNAQTRTPPTMSVMAPAVFDNAVIGSTAIVEACRPHLPANGNPGALVLGVIELGTKATKGNAPWMIIDPAKDVHGNPRPDADALRAAASDLWQRIASGQFTNPVPTKLGPPAAGSAYAPALQGLGYAPMQAQYPGTTAAPQGPYYPAPAPTAAPASTPAGGIPAPPGWDPTQWASIPPEHQAVIAAAAAAPQMPQHPGI